MTPVLHSLSFTSLLLLSALPAQTFGSPQFSPGAALLGNFTVADVDGDGLPDLVGIQSNLVSGNLCAYRGNGLGGFTQTNSSLVVSPYDFVVADVDGDQHPDVWVGGANSGSVRLHGNGDGTFVSSPAPTLPHVFCLADFDGDGRLDSMVRTATGYDVALGDGAGNFGAPIPVAANTGINVRLRAGDLDGDGDIDVLASANPAGQLLLLRNDGTAHFTAEPANLPGGFAAWWIALADIDGDGDLDVLTEALFVGVAVFANDGTGHFSNTPLFSNAWATHIVAGDVDGDGHPDLVMNDFRQNAPELWLYHGDGTGAFRTSESFEFGVLASSFVLADVNLDGGLDVIGVGGGPGYPIFVLPNQQASAAGVAAFGTGTGACSGRLGMRAITPPTVGNQDFQVLCSNAPVNREGLLLLGTCEANGWDPYGLGLVLHLGVLVAAGTMSSDNVGSGVGRLPIPPAPFLAGLTVGLQSIWFADPGVGDTCSSAMAELVSSRGLSVTVQP